MDEECDWVEPPPLSVFTVQDQPVYACCYDHSEAPMTVTQLEPTSSVPKAIAHFTREGTTEACGSRATLKLSRFEDVLDHSRSQLGLVLAHDNYNDVDVMNLKSNGEVNVNGSLKVGGTAVALETEIPTATDILNTTSVSASASSGSTAGVAVTNTTNGVNLAFTIPPGADGADGATGATGATGAKGDKGDKGDTGATGSRGEKGDKCDTGAGLNSSGVLDISKNGEVAKFQPATSGNHTLINFNSKVNSGSDRGFILVQDESAEPGGSSSEDLRMTIGVYNDFKQSSAHSDELWLQGGGRLCYNVGSWDSELNTIIGTPGVGTALGGLKHEWRLSNSTKMTLNTSGLYLNDGWFRTYGSRGRYNETHKGGWYMTDSTWMRTYNQKSIWAGDGKICCNGNMGAGTSSPQHKLDVRGTARADVFMTDYEYKTQDAGVVKHGGVLAMDQLTWRRVVPQRWSGYIVWTPVANDHAAFAMRVVVNSNAGDGSRDWRQQTDYYSSARYITSRWNGGWLEFSKAGTNASFTNPHYYHVTMYGAFI